MEVPLDQRRADRCPFGAGLLEVGQFVDEQHPNEEPLCEDQHQRTEGDKTNLFVSSNLFVNNNPLDNSNLFDKTSSRCPR